MSYFDNTALSCGTAAVRISQPMPREVRPQVVTTVRYYNRCGVPISIVSRNGTINTLPSSYELGANKELLIEYQFEIDNDVIIDIEELYSNVQSQDAKESIILKEAIEARDYVQYTGYRTYTVQYIIGLDYLHSHGGSVYYTNLDVVVSAVNREYLPKHPYSDEGRREVLVRQDLAINHLERFGFSIEIVDNHREFGDRFINISGIVYHIPVKADVYRESGIWVTASGEAMGGRAVKRPFSRRYDFKDVGQGPGKIDLHKTYDEAMSYGDPVAMLDRDIKLTQAANKLDEEKIKRERKERDEIMEAKKTEIALLRLELDQQKKATDHLYEQREMERKDYYESRAYARKDSSEVIKYIPVLISLALGLKALMGK